MRKVLASLIEFFEFSGIQASDFPPIVEMNEKTIQALIEAGSNSKKPHPHEYHFYDTDSLESSMVKGKALGYQVANTGDNIHEGIHYWYGYLIKETALDLLSAIKKFFNDSS